MSAPASHTFGSVRGLASGDVRIVIGAKARKNLLCLVVSYLKVAIGAAPAAFHGRILIVDGQLPDTPDITVVATPNVGKVLQDIILHDPGPHSFFFPLSQLEGNVRTDEGGILTIVLCKADDGAAGSYIPILNAAGKTEFGGALSGQTGVS